MRARRARTIIAPSAQPAAGELPPRAKAADALAEDRYPDISDDLPKRLPAAEFAERHSETR
jgi:hypothetical protein